MAKPQRIFEGDGDPRHGSLNGYINLGCRCPPCTAANTVDHALRQAKPRPPLPPGDPRHGTSSGYRWWKCKCGMCLAKNAEDVARSAARRRKSA